MFTCICISICRSLYIYIYMTVGYRTLHVLKPRSPEGGGGLAVFHSSLVYLCYSFDSLFPSIFMFFLSCFRSVFFVISFLSFFLVHSFFLSLSLVLPFLLTSFSTRFAPRAHVPRSGLTCPACGFHGGPFLLFLFSFSLSLFHSFFRSFFFLFWGMGPKPRTPSPAPVLEPLQWTQVRACLSSTASTRLLCYFDTLSLSLSRLLACSAYGLSEETAPVGTLHRVSRCETGCTAGCDNSLSLSLSLSVSLIHSFVGSFFLSFFLSFVSVPLFLCSGPSVVPSFLALLPRSSPALGPCLFEKVEASRVKNLEKIAPPPPPPPLPKKKKKTSRKSTYPALNP